MRTSVFLACVIGATGLVVAGFGTLVLSSAAKEAGKAMGTGMKVLTLQTPSQPQSPPRLYTVNRAAKGDRLQQKGCGGCDHDEHDEGVAVASAAPAPAVK